MTETPESGGGSDDPREPDRPLRPKRGAFPSPQSEIDRAEPYIPDGGEEDAEEGEPDTSPESDSEKDE
nr:hypothetical protein GCM10010200_026840 [Actinomadura rugatobispora]